MSLSKYFRSSGTAAPGELWGAALVWLALALTVHGCLAVANQVPAAALVALLAFLLSIVAFIATANTLARRMTTLGHAQAWALLILVPLLNLLVILYAGTARGKGE